MVVDKNTEITLEYDTTFKAEVVEKDGKKYVSLSGTLMNDKMNANFWRVTNEDLPQVASSFSGIPIKVQHAHSDWEIVGTGVSASHTGNSISYLAKVTDNRAIEKFESGTWNSENMGMSPAIKSTDVVCSICGEAAMTCPHLIGEKYKDETAHIIVKTPKSAEASLTSTPAYKDVGAGTVDSITMGAFVASINKNKTEDIKMSDKKLEELEAEMVKLKEKVKTAETKTAEVEDDKKKLEKEKEEKEEAEKEKLKKEKEKAKKAEAEGDGEDGSEDNKELEAENKKLKEEMNGLKTEVRTAELLKVVSDKEFVAEILSKEMSDSEFKAELEKIGKIKKLSVAETDGTDDNGSAPPEGGEADEGNKTLVEKEFGMTAEDMAKKIMT